MITETDNSSMLVLALKKGDTEGYRQLVQQYGESMHQYAQRIVGDPGTAQDIVQDALLRLYKFRKKLDPKLELRSLCFRAVRNLARNHLRDVNLRRMRETEAEDMRQGNQKRTPELATEAWNCAEQLSDDQREVIDLRFTFGLSRAEVAAVLEIPEGTVATRQRNALAEIKQKLTARSVSPAMLAASPLSGLLTSGGQASLSNPYTLNILNMEEVIMTGIRRMKLKTAGLAASAALVLLFLTGVAGLSLAGNSENPEASNNQIIAQQDSNSVSATPDNDPAFNSGAANSSPANNSTGNATPTPENSSTPSANTETNVNNGESTIPPVEPTEVSELPEVEPAPVESAPVEPAVSPTGLPPAFDSVPPTFITVGEDYMYMIETHGQPRPEITARKLPNWLKLEDGLLYGMPSAKDAGETPIILYADNGIKPVAEQRFLIQVATAPGFTSTPIITAETGVSYSYTITVSGTPAPVITAAGLPKWLTLKASTLSGTPDASMGGVTGTITLTASNGAKPDAAQDFTITVNTPPAFVSKPIESVMVGVEYRYEIKLEGTPAPKLTAKGLPKWLKLEGNVLSGTPRNKYLGKSAKVVLKASNGIGKKVEQKFKVKVLTNPDYVEMPWTIEELRKYFKVGLKWSGKGSKNVAMGKIIYNKHRYEVTKIVGDDVTVKFVLSVPNTAREVITWSDSEHVSVWSLTEIAKNPFHYVGASSKVSVNKITAKGTEKLKLAGKIYKCHVFEVIVDVKGGQSPTMRLYFIDGKPGIAAKIEYIYPLDNGKVRPDFEVEKIED